jgi:hypothetical protein
MLDEAEDPQAGVIGPPLMYVLSALLDYVSAEMKSHLWRVPRNIGKA